MTKQQSLIDVPEDEIAIPTSCRYHKRAISRADFVETVVKKTGKILWKCKYCVRQKEINQKIYQQELQKEKEELTDYYIIKTMRRGKDRVKALNGQDIPKELIEAKRLTLRIKKFIENSKKPVKKCAKHGDLLKSDTVKAGLGRTGNPLLRCKQCLKESHAKSYEKNKETVLDRRKKWTLLNQEKIKEIKRRSRLKQREKEKDKSRKRWAEWSKRNPEKAREINRKSKLLSVKNLNASYVVGKIIRNTTLTRKDISNDLVDAHRAVLLLRRGVKKLKGETKIINQIPEKEK